MERAEKFGDKKALMANFRPLQLFFTMFMTLNGSLVLKLHAARQSFRQLQKLRDVRMSVAKLGKKELPPRAAENHFQFHSQLLEDMQSKSRPKVCKI